MTTTRISLLQCQVVEEDVQMTLAELCQACDADSALVRQLVEHGVIEPQGAQPQAWVFAGASLRRTRVALRLLRDLELNPPGAALAWTCWTRSRLQRELQAASGLRRADRRPGHPPETGHGPDIEHLRCWIGHRDAAGPGHRCRRRRWRRRWTATMRRRL